MTLEEILKAVQEGHMPPEEASRLISRLRGADGQEGAAQREAADDGQQTYVGNIGGDLPQGVRGTLRGHVGGDVCGDIAGSMVGNVGGDVRGAILG
ncbi:MAG: hypothetical protein ACLSX2_08550, partial [Christensenellaceae bacterium]